MYDLPPRRRISLILVKLGPAHTDEGRRVLYVLFFWYILYIIQLTPQKLSAEHKNRAGAEGASAWPEDQKRHRGGTKSRGPSP